MTQVLSIQGNPFFCGLLNPTSYGPILGNDDNAPTQDLGVTPASPKRKSGQDFLGEEENDGQKRPRGEDKISYRSSPYVRQDSMSPEEHMKWLQKYKTI